jgi:hypothetical protein
MAEGRVEEIIELAVADADFRRRLLEDPQSACAGYGLNEAELKQLTESCQQAFAGELDARISKKRIGAKFAGFTGPLGIDGIQE